MLASMMEKLLLFLEEGTNGASFCAAHRQVTRLEIGLHVRNKSNVGQCQAVTPRLCGLGPLGQL